MTQRRYQKLLEQYHRSGLSIRAFCLGQKIPLATFYWWRRRFGTSRHGEKSAAEFVELCTSKLSTGAAPDHSVLPIVLHTGTLTVELPQEISASAVTGLLSALRQAGLC